MTSIQLHTQYKLTFFFFSEIVHLSYYLNGGVALDSTARVCVQRQPSFGVTFIV